MAIAKNGIGTTTIGGHRTDSSDLRENRQVPSPQGIAGL